MAETTEVLSLLLTARYVGAPAFASMAHNIETLVNSTSGLAKVGAGMSLVGAGLTAVGVGLAATAVEAMKQAAAYQDAIQRMVSVHAIATDQITALNQAIMQTSDRFGQNSTDIASGLYFVTSTMNGLGMSIANNKAVAQQFFDYVIPAMGAMVAASGHGLQGSITWQQAGQDVTHIAAAMNTPLAQWPALMGSMTLVENNAGLTQQQLVQATLRAAPTARELGASYQDLFAAIGATATAGGYGARAGTELGAGYRQMLTNSTSLKALASIGLSPGQFFGKGGQLKDTGTLLAMIDSRLLNIGNPAQRFALQQQIFGAVGNRTFGLLAQPKTLGIYQSLLSGESQNPVARMFGVADSQLSSFAGTLAKLQAAFQNFLKAVGGPLIQAVQPYLNRLAGALNQLTTALSAPKGLELLAKAPQLLFGGAAFGLTTGPALQLGGGLLRDFALKQDAKHTAYLKAVERWSASGKSLKPAYVPTAGEKLVEKLWTKPTKSMLAFGQRFSPLHLGASAFVAARAGVAHLSLPKGLPDFGALFGGLKALPKSALRGILGFFKDIGGAVKAAVPAVLSFGSALLPIIAVALLIAGAITIGVLAFTRYRAQVLGVVEVFKSAFAPVFAFVLGVVQSVLKQITGTWKSHQKEIDAAMQQLMTAISQAAPFFQELGFVIGAVIAVIVKVIGYLVTAFVAALPYIIGVFTNIFCVLGDLGNLVQAILQGKWGMAWDFAKKALADAWAVIKSLLQALWTFISQVFVNLWNDIKGPLGSLWNSVTQWFSNLGKGIQTALVNALSGLGNAVKGAVMGALHFALQALPGGPVAQSVFNALGVGGLIGHHAAGGYISSGMLSWVGEKGPELVKLPGGSRVYSHQDSLGLLSSPLTAPLHSTWGTHANVQQQFAPLRDELGHLVDAVKALQPQRSPAEEYFFTRQVQEQREAVWNRYPNTSREFDHTYRKAYQYYG